MGAEALDYVIADSVDIDRAERLRSLWDSAEQIAQTGSWEYLTSEQRLIWSDNLYRIFGHAPGDVEPSFELILARTDPADRERVARTRREFVAGRKVRTMEYRITRPDGVQRHLRATLAATEHREDVPHRHLGIVQDITDSRSAEREIAAHVAVQEALVEWDAFETGSHRLLAALGPALDCIAGTLWTPHGEVLVARVRWDDGDLRSPAMADERRPRRLARGVGLAGRVWEAGKPLSWTLGDAAGDDSRAAASATPRPLVGAVAVPAIDGDDVLAVLEFNADREIRISERLLRSLHGIAYELGHFLARRRAELAAPLLTAREIEVLQLGAEGLTARMTAERLMVSPATVRTHLENIYQKLEVSDKASAVATALRLGIIN